MEGMKQDNLALEGSKLTPREKKVIISSWMASCGEQMW